MFKKDLLISANLFYEGLVYGKYVNVPLMYCYLFEVQLSFGWKMYIFSFD